MSVSAEEKCQSKSQVSVVADSTDGSSSAVINDTKKNLPWSKRVLRVLWDSADKPKDERAFLFKLDMFFLSSICAGYFIKTLNLNNLKYAYINGMKDDLGLHGGQFNYIQTMWTVGYILGQIPSQMILHHVPARYYLGGLEIVWSILTVLTVTVNSYHSMCAMRFFVGLTEAGFFPGVEYLLGSWYSHDEVTKRATIFAQSGTAASMVSGYLQVAIIKGLQNKGLVPYKWIFILDAVISFPIAIYTMFFNPNTPETTTSWYFNSRDKEIALERRKRIGAATKKNISWKSCKRLARSWIFYVFPLMFLAFNNAWSVNTQPTFQSWLKFKGYSPEDYNLYPTAVDGVGIGISMIFGWICDYFNGVNWPFVVIYFVLEMTGCAILGVHSMSDGGRWFGYFLSGSANAIAQPMIFAWLNQLLYCDNEVRNLAVVITNNMAYITNAFVPIFVWNAKDIPFYYTGYTYTACLTAFGLIMTILATYLTYTRPYQPNIGMESEVEELLVSEDVKLSFKTVAPIKS